MKIFNLNNYAVKDLIDPSLSQSNKVIYRDTIRILSEGGFIEKEFILTESAAHKIIVRILGDNNLRAKLYDEASTNKIIIDPSIITYNGEHLIDHNIETVKDLIEEVCNDPPMGIVMCFMRIMYNHIRQNSN